MGSLKKKYFLSGLAEGRGIKGRPQRRKEKNQNIYIYIKSTYYISSQGRIQRKCRRVADFPWRVVREARRIFLEVPESSRGSRGFHSRGSQRQFYLKFHAFLLFLLGPRGFQRVPNPKGFRNPLWSSDGSMEPSQLRS